MMSFEYFVLSYLLNCLWQLPLILACGWVSSRLAGKAGTAAKHKIWVLALAASVLLPACSSNISLLLERALEWVLRGGEIAAAGSVSAEVVKASGSGLAITIPAWLRLTILAAYAASVCYEAMGIAWRGVRTWMLSRRLRGLPTSAWVEGGRERCAGLCSGAVELAVSPDVSVPGTVGIFRQCVILPVGFLEEVSEADLSAVLAHECAHVERNDFLKNILYGAAALPVAWHPCCRLIGDRLAESREMICDERAASVGGSSRQYAQSLLRVTAMLSVRPELRSSHAVSISGNDNLERRIMNLTRTKQPVSFARRVFALAACGALAFATCAFATALRVALAEPGHGTAAESPKKVDVNALSIVEKRPPIYPAAAKKKGQQGIVRIKAIIGKEGRPENLKIIKSVS